ncbi:hypothetical protein K431DRAFT_288339 [Polychaeton citri CBS 116435]|uniref:Uncharacterized protein n=1 Tax=Polychaeton citri CBS 116435 TaxID=1314669 RepID=A0A9P4Q1E9_9PEZI|nr:hypothetical protein K431DRAFT_288339 [Polychaeton citri CBS 116435]
MRRVLQTHGQTLVLEVLTLSWQLALISCWRLREIDASTDACTELMKAYLPPGHWCWGQTGSGSSKEQDRHSISAADRSKTIEGAVLLVAKARGKQRPYQTLNTAISRTIGEY